MICMTKSVISFPTFCLFLLGRHIIIFFFTHCIIIQIVKETDVKIRGNEQQYKIYGIISLVWKDVTTVPFSPLLPHSRLHLCVWSWCSLEANPSSWQHSPCRSSGSPAELLAAGGTWALEVLALNPLHHCCRYHHRTAACLNSGPVYHFHQHLDRDSEKVCVDAYVCGERVG